MLKKGRVTEHNQLKTCNFIGEILNRATYVVRRNWAVILIKRKENFLMMCVEEGESYRA